MLRDNLKPNKALNYRPKRLRPLARRRAITARPPLVAMRTKKPCVVARRVLEG